MYEDAGCRGHATYVYDSSGCNATTTLGGLLSVRTTSVCVFNNSTKKCFSGSETVTMESGEIVSIADVVVGDKVLSADNNGRTFFSAVVSIPHSRNEDPSRFSHITTSTGKDVKMSPDHLLPAGTCGGVFSLVQAEDVEIDSCIRTVDGEESVVSNTFAYSFGLYTLVTEAEYVVVNGIVASPFAQNHLMANSFYNLYRTFFAYVPGLFSSGWFLKAHERFGDLVALMSA